MAEYIFLILHQVLGRRAAVPLYCQLDNQGLINYQ